MAELGDGDGGGASEAGTRLGHVHLQVADIPTAEGFYHDVLGFDVTVRSYPGALFLSAGGYHHHVGVNTWASAGAPPPPPGSAGMSRLQLVVPEADDAAAMAQRARAAGLELREAGKELEFDDPSGHRVAVHADDDTRYGGDNDRGTESDGET